MLRSPCLAYISISSPTRYQEPAKQGVLASRGLQSAQLCGLFLTIPLRLDLVSLQSDSWEACSDPKARPLESASEHLPSPKEAEQEEQPAGRGNTLWLLSKVAQ